MIDLVIASHNQGKALDLAASLKAARQVLALPAILVFLMLRRPVKVSKKMPFSKRFMPLLGSLALLWGMIRACVFPAGTTNLVFTPNDSQCHRGAGPMRCMP